MAGEAVRPRAAARHRQREAAAMPKHTSKALFKAGNNSDRLLYYHKSCHRLARASMYGYHMAEFLDRIIYILHSQSVYAEIQTQHFAANAIEASGHLHRLCWLAAAICKLASHWLPVPSSLGSSLKNLDTQYLNPAQWISPIRDF